MLPSASRRQVKPQLLAILIGLIITITTTTTHAFQSVENCVRSRRQRVFSVKVLYMSDDKKEPTVDNVSIADNNFGFGDSVPLNNNNNKRSTTDAAAFGDVVPFLKPSATVLATPENSEILTGRRRRNFGVAALSVLFAFSNFAWQYAHPITPVQLLFAMEQHNAPLSSIGANSKPTVVDFWAPWYVHRMLSYVPFLSLNDGRPYK
jgi:hypothetical protein